jgi:subtilisin family serine protease
LYAYGSGTSYSAPQVSGAAALVWAAKPSLTADGVVEILEQTATGGGTWNAGTGYGVLDAASAVAWALGVTAPPRRN